MRKTLMTSLVWFALASSQAFANVVGADSQNFNPTPDGLDFVTVHSSKTLLPGLFNVGVFLNYAVNSLPNYEDTTTSTRTNFQDALLSSDLNIAVGLMRNWEVGFSMPMLLYQSVDSDLNTFRGQFASTGVTEYRGMTKLRVWGDHNYGVAAVGSVNINRIEDNPFAGDGAGPTYNLELAADTMIGAFQWGVNVGYRIRNPGEQLPGIPVEPFDDQYIYSTALSYLLTDWDTKLIGEFYGSMPVQTMEFISDRDASTLEFLIGAKTDLTPTLALHVGGATEIVHGSSSPDWRVYTGLNWVIGPIFSQPQEVVVKVDDQPLTALEELDAIDPYAEAPQLTESFIARDILFEFNSDKMKPAAEANLQKLIDHLNKPPEFTKLTVEGHTDSIGNPAYNLDLSQRRARAVRAKLIQMGLPAAKVRSVGYGASRPIANNGNYQGRAMNRRVEFKVERTAQP